MGCVGGVCLGRQLFKASAGRMHMHRSETAFVVRDGTSGMFGGRFGE